MELNGHSQIKITAICVAAIMAVTATGYSLKKVTEWSKGYFDHPVIGDSLNVDSIKTPNGQFTDMQNSDNLKLRFDSNIVSETPRQMDNVYRGATVAKENGFLELSATTNNNSLKTDTKENINSKETQVKELNVITSSKSTAYKEYASELLAYSDLPYFIMGKSDRYINYKIKNPNYSYDKIITYVNIGLDKPYFANVNAVSDPNNIDIVVNKYNKLPNNYVPKTLKQMDKKYVAVGRSVEICSNAYEAFKILCNDAAKLGFKLYASSGYRSYSTQVYTYNSYVKSDGKTAADTYSARPGFSEHQTGLAIDVIKASKSAHIENTAVYKWYKDNAYKYGFIIRYPENKDNITGYVFEPWHLRYLGKDLATAVYKSGLTYDEYYVRYIAPAKVNVEKVALNNDEERVLSK